MKNPLIKTFTLGDMKSNLADYVEFEANDLDEAKNFHTQAFKRYFTDHGPDM